MTKKGFAVRASAFTVFCAGLMLAALPRTVSAQVNVASVQFQIDGVNVGGPITAPPYSLAWNTQQVGNGTHLVSTLIADTSGNLTLSDPFPITVNNANPAPGLNAALVYPDPVLPSYDPTIRICPGIVDDVDITIFNVAGRVVNSGTVGGGTSFIPTAGEGAGQDCYEYVWTGHKASGAYFAVVHAKGPGTTVNARLKFAVVR